MVTGSVSLTPLVPFPLVQPGDDLAALIRALHEPVPGDVLVVTAKIVSKSEGRVVDLNTIAPSPRAERLAALTEKDPRLVELALQESVEVVRARPGILVVRHRLGFVSAMAGIDRSNVDGDESHALLLPADPDASAARLRKELGGHPGIVISDSHGRAFRYGNVGVAIGVAGVPALVQLEGRPDLFKRPLTTASQVPTADLVAAAAALLSGEADEGIPVVLIQGLASATGRTPEAEHARATDLVRDPDRDMFAIPDQSYE